MIGTPLTIQREHRPQPGPRRPSAFRSRLASRPRRICSCRLRSTGPHRARRASELAIISINPPASNSPPTILTGGACLHDRYTRYFRTICFNCYFRSARYGRNEEHETVHTRRNLGDLRNTGMKNLSRNSQSHTGRPRDTELPAGRATGLKACFRVLLLGAASLIVTSPAAAAPPAESEAVSVRIVDRSASVSKPITPPPRTTTIAIVRPERKSVTGLAVAESSPTQTRRPVPVAAAPVEAQPSPEPSQAERLVVEYPRRPAADARFYGRPKLDASYVGEPIRCSVSSSQAKNAVTPASARSELQAKPPSASGKNLRNVNQYEDPPSNGPRSAAQPEPKAATERSETVSNSR